MTQTDPSPHAREDHPGPIHSVFSLRDALTDLLNRGCDPGCAVVIANDGWYDELDANLNDPTLEEDPMGGDYLWVTLNPVGPADPRFTPGHTRSEPTRQDSPTDVVGWAMQSFWDDESNTVEKASEYDTVFHAAQALEAAGYSWSAAAVRRAADVGYVMGQYGVDQKIDRQYHAVIAATILETEDV